MRKTNKRLQKEVWGQGIVTGVLLLLSILFPWLRFKLLLLAMLFGLFTVIVALPDKKEE